MRKGIPFIAFIDLTKAFDPVIRKGLSNLLQTIGSPHKLQRMTAFSKKEPSSAKAQHQTPSQSRAKWSRAVYLLPHFSASFSPPSAVLRLQPLSRWCIPSQQKWRKPLQPCTPPSKDQVSESTDKRDAICKRRRPYRTYWGCFKAIHQLLRSRLLGIWSHHQFQEEQNPWPRRQQLEVVEDFTYLGSTISSNLSLHSDLNKRIGKPVTALCLAHLGERV